jgi:hypothetical protein
MQTNAVAGVGRAGLFVGGFLGTTARGNAGGISGANGRLDSFFPVVGPSRHKADHRKKKRD